MKRDRQNHCFTCGRTFPSRKAVKQHLRYSRKHNNNNNPSVAPTLTIFTPISPASTFNTSVPEPKPTPTTEATNTTTSPSPEPNPQTLVEAEAPPAAPDPYDLMCTLRYSGNIQEFCTNLQSLNSNPPKLTGAPLRDLVKRGLPPEIRYHCSRIPVPLGPDDDTFFAQITEAVGEWEVKRDDKRWRQETGWVEDTSGFVCAVCDTDLYSKDSLLEHENTVHRSLADVAEWCRQNLRREEKEVWEARKRERGLQGLPEHIFGEQETMAYSGSISEYCDTMRELGRRCSGATFRFMVGRGLPREIVRRYVSVHGGLRERDCENGEFVDRLLDVGMRYEEYLREEEGFREDMVQIRVCGSRPGVGLGVGVECRCCGESFGGEQALQEHKGSPRHRIKMISEGKFAELV